MESNQTKSEEIFYDEVEQKQTAENKRRNNYSQPQPDLLFRRLGLLTIIILLFLIIIVMLLHIIIVAIFWTNNSAYFHDPEEILQMLLNYCKEEFYLFYMSIRHWNHYKDGKLHVVLENHFAS